MICDCHMMEVSTIKIPEKVYIAICIWNGRYGSGKERKEAINQLGYKESEIQEIVNLLAPYYE